MSLEIDYVMTGLVSPHMVKLQFQLWQIVGVSSCTVCGTSYACVFCTKMDVAVDLNVIPYDAYLRFNCSIFVGGLQNWFDRMYGLSQLVNFPLNMRGNLHQLWQQVVICADLPSGLGKLQPESLAREFGGKLLRIVAMNSTAHASRPAVVYLDAHLDTLEEIRPEQDGCELFPDGLIEQVIHHGLLHEVDSLTWQFAP